MNATTDFLTKIRSLSTASEQRAVRSVYADFLDDENKTLDAARQRVLAFPDSDERREEFALQLEQDGQDDWAKFVRLQVELSRGFQCKNPRYEEIYSDFYGNSSVDRVFRGNCRICDPCLHNKIDRMEANAVLMGQCTLISGKVKEHDINWISWRFPAPAGYCMDAGVIPCGPNMGILFARGLISEIQCPWEGQYGWKANGDAITDAHPIEKVTLVTTPELRRIANAEQGIQWYQLMDCRWRHGVKWQEWEYQDYHRLPRFEQELRLTLLKEEWPGIEFVLPSQQNDPEEEAVDF